MAIIYEYNCNRCDFSECIGDEVYLYGVDSSGKRIQCVHPGELDFLRTVEGHIGHGRFYLCLECLQKFGLDIDREDEDRCCPYCGSPQVTALRDLVEGCCPKCESGRIERRIIGMS